MEFKVGDKVRVIVDDHHFFDKGHEFVVDRVDIDGYVYDKNNICILKHHVELVTSKQSKKQRIEALEKEVAELKERVEALEQGDIAKDKETHKTPNQQRKEIIEKAKKFVACTKRLIESNHSYYAEFIVNAEKRTVVCLLRSKWTGNVLSKSIAKCTPTDVFNEHIGKAIALGRVRKIDVSEFENAVQTTEVVVGMNVKGESLDETFYVHGFHEDEKLHGMYGRSIAIRGINNPLWIGTKQVTIINDTNAEYGVNQ